jgi:hypothetical protein
MTTELRDLTQAKLDEAYSMNLAECISTVIRNGGGFDSGFDMWRQSNPNALLLRAKAAVNPGTVAEPAWGAPLAQLKPAIDAVLRRVYAKLIRGRLLGARQVPLSTAGAVQTSAASYAWAGEGAPKIVSNMQFASATLGIAKASGIVILSAELAKLGATGVIRDSLERGLVEFFDQQFFDPTVAAAADRPGSILNTAPSIGSAGTSAANALTDVKALMKQFFANNPDADFPYWVMNPANAAAIAVALNVTELTTLFTIPVIASSSAGARVAIVDAGQLLMAGGEDLSLDIARHATVEMNTATASPPTASNVMVNLWHHGLVGLKVEQAVNWKLAKPSAAIYTNVAYV